MVVGSRTLCASIWAWVHAPHILFHSHVCMHHVCSSTAVCACTPHSSVVLWVLGLLAFLHSYGCTHPIHSSTAVGACTMHALPLQWMIPCHILFHSYICMYHAPAWLPALPTITILHDWESILLCHSCGWSHPVHCYTAVGAWTMLGHSYPKHFLADVFAPHVLFYACACNTPCTAPSVWVHIPCAPPRPGRSSAVTGASLTLWVWAFCALLRGGGAFTPPRTPPTWGCAHPTCAHPRPAGVPPFPPPAWGWRTPHYQRSGAR